MAVVTMNATSRFEPQMKRAFWFTCLVVVAGALSPQGPEQVTFVLSDKLVHAGAFFVLSIFGLKAYPTHTLRIIVFTYLRRGAGIENSARIHINTISGMGRSSR